jgi:hypothetical protein
MKEKIIATLIGLALTALIVLTYDTWTGFWTP